MNSTLTFWKSYVSNLIQVRALEPVYSWGTKAEGRCTIKIPHSKLITVKVVWRVPRLNTLILKTTKLYLYNSTFIMFALSNLASSSLGCSSTSSCFISPTYTHAKESGRIHKCQVQLRTISIRSRSYQMTNLLVEGNNIQFQIRTLQRLIFMSCAISNFKSHVPSQSPVNHPGKGSSVHILLSNTCLEVCGL